MRLFKCQNCGHVAYFDNTTCAHCGVHLGYLPDIGELSAVEPAGPEWIAQANPRARYRYCRNWEVNACNWLVPTTDGTPYCRACRHNRTVSGISDPDNHRAWQKIEDAKRRLFYTLLHLQLPIPDASSGDPQPLRFDFLADPPDGTQVMTGHNHGLITIALSEGHDPQREASRVSMGERYRTVLGHFRHEVGHYYWDRLVRDGGELDHFRTLFGDERADYGQALQRHYAQGAPNDWQNAYVSTYATSHPWEDWAETWTHYLHIVDTLEMAAAYGIRVAPTIVDSPQMRVAITGDPHNTNDIQQLIDTWLPLTYALNSLSRTMGQPDLYPFVIPPPVVEKMAWIHTLVRRAAQREG